jgi:transcriptional regulator with XRE-family HTH domain
MVEQRDGIAYASSSILDYSTKGVIVGKPNKVVEREKAIELRLIGKSMGEIADELGVSKSSVSLWVRGLRDNNTQDYPDRFCEKCGNPIPKSIRINGKRVRVDRPCRKYCLECSPLNAHKPPTDFSGEGDNRICRKCGKSLSPEDFYTNGGGRRRVCKSCGNAESMRRRIANKKAAIEYLGGKCIKCGYSQNLSAIDFHHRDSSEKEALISALLARYGDIDPIKQELDKCVVMCSNCHRALHHPEMAL